MTTISSNTLFHFTNSADNIIQIIRKGFTPKFCLEEFGPEILIGKGDKEELAIPMSCFCDLPLSMINEHLGFYGSYGIGLRKEWGQENGLTPLTYIHENSIQLTYIRQIATIITHIDNNDLDKPAVFEHPLVALFELAAFFKPYKGQIWRINKYIEKNFYDEREWRYVPFLNSLGIDYRLSKEEFLNNVKRAAANEIISKNFALNFLSSDIKYLIVKKEAEMISLCDALDQMPDIYKASEIKILKTKVISSEQIMEDF